MVQKSKINPFDTYEVEPSPAVWQRVVENLPPPRNRKRAWFLWTAAATFAGLIFFSAYFLEVDVRLRHHAPGGQMVEDRGQRTEDGGQKAEGRGLMTENRGLKTTDGGQKKYVQDISVDKSGKGTRLTHEGKRTVVQADGRTSVSRYTKTSGSISRRGEEQNAAPVASITKAPGMPVVQQQELSSLAPVEKIRLAEAPLLLANAQPKNPVGIGVDFSDRPVRKISRWQIAFLGSADYCYRDLAFQDTQAKIATAVKDQLSSNESGIHAWSSSLTAQYSLGSHFNIVSGLAYIASGQERSQSQVSLASGNPGPSSIYSVGTSAGNVSGYGDLFNMAYYNNSDSSLFHVNAAVPTDNTSANFLLEQQFHFVSLPLIAQYQPAERRFTPYVGVGVSVSYLVDDKIYLNGNRLDYSYADQLNKVMFSAEAQAGLKYNAWKQVAFRLQPTFRYGLQSLNKSEQVHWIPWSFGVGFGFSYRY